MTEKLEHSIISIAPWMFDGYTKSPQESCLSFGFECADGWYDVIKDLITKLSKVDKNKAIIIDQIKEKFGSLRFYYSLKIDMEAMSNSQDYDKQIDKIIDKYERKSAKTCEVCGRKGKIRSNGGWLSCVCRKHWRK